MLCCLFYPPSIIANSQKSLTRGKRTGLLLSCARRGMDFQVHVMVSDRQSVQPYIKPTCAVMNAVRPPFCSAMRSSSYLPLLCLVAGASATGDFKSACSGFKPTNIPNVELTNPPTYFAANAVVNISNSYSSIDESTLPAFCRVELTITTNTTEKSTALAEVWLPNDWNGRMLTVGNGGISGGGKWILVLLDVHLNFH